MYVNVEILNSIAVVKFNRPKALNALSTEMTKELSDLFDKLAVNDSVRGIILTGEGKAFMAGADITEMKEWGAFEGIRRRHPRGHRAFAGAFGPRKGGRLGRRLGGLPHARLRQDRHVPRRGQCEGAHQSDA